MSALFAILLAQAINPAYPNEPPRPPKKPIEFVDLGDRTPTLDKFECQLVGNTMNSGALSFQVEGGRAYSIGNEFDEAGRVPLDQVARTPRMIKILTDELQIFADEISKVSVMRGDDSQLFNTKLRWRLISAGKILEFWSDTDSDEMLLAKITKGDLLLQASGLCRRTAFPQLPLSPSEAEGLNK